MLILALAYQMTGQTETALRTLSDFLAEGSALPDTIIARMLIGQTYVHFRVGNLHQAAQVLHRLQQVAGNARLTVSMVIANWLLGRISYEWNHLEPASRYLLAAFELRYKGNYGMVCDSSMTLALTYQAQGRPDKAEEALVALRRFALDIRIMERLVELDSFNARLAVVRGDLQPAIRWVETTPTDMPSGYTFVLLELPVISRARVLIAKGTEASLQEAVRLLQELLTFTGPMHSTYRQIELLAHLALAHQAQGKINDALFKLERAVKLAQPGGFIRTFVDLGPEMAKLLYHLAERGITPEYLGQVLAAFDEPTMVEGQKTKDTFVSLREPASAALIVVPLTSRELEILKLLEQDLSNKEISQVLVISPLTVKRHASNIYAKLGVSGRMKAVAKARTLSLLPSD
jgi:LuxR family maltose regulon positive regulatory protein